MYQTRARGRRPLTRSYVIHTALWRKSSCLGRWEGGRGYGWKSSFLAGLADQAAILNVKRASLGGSGSGAGHETHDDDDWSVGERKAAAVTCSGSVWAEEEEEGENVTLRFWGKTTKYECELQNGRKEGRTDGRTGDGSRRVAHAQSDAPLHKGACGRRTTGSRRPSASARDAPFRSLESRDH